MFAHGYSYGEPPPYGAGMPPPFPPPGDPGFGPPGMPPPGMMMPGLMPGMPGMMPPPGGMMPPPGFGDPVGFLLPSLFKAIGGLFGGRRPPPPPPMMTVGPGGALPPMPDLFFRDRPLFCRTYCPPMPGMPGMVTPGAVGRRRRRRRGGSRLGEPVGAIPLIAALAPLAASILPGIIQGLTGGGGSNLSGYYGPPPPPAGYAGW